MSIMQTYQKRNEEIQDSLIKLKTDSCLNNENYCKIQWPKIESNKFTELGIKFLGKRLKTQEMRTIYLKPSCLFLFRECWSNEESLHHKIYILIKKIIW